MFALERPTFACIRLALEDGPTSSSAVSELEVFIETVYRLRALTT
jgi:hypothetical protein